MISCESKKNNAIEKNITETQKYELNENEKEELLRKEINKQYLTEVSKC